MNSVLVSVRETVKKHEDLLFKIAFLLALDHFIFDGQMRNKIKDVAEKIFNKVMKSLD